MIGYIRGTLRIKDDQKLLVETQGVGYMVLASLPVLRTVAIGQEIEVFTYTYVKEDALELFGFKEYEDLTLFEQLISVSGIGPKTALSIFSVGDRQVIEGAIAQGDVSFFTSVPRLGTKNAQKLIIELKNKMGKNGEASLAALTHQDNEVGMALKAFGFSSREVQDVLSALRQQGKQDLPVQEQVKHALKYLGK